jgi:hypothetical protein
MYARADAVAAPRATQHERGERAIARGAARGQGRTVWAAEAMPEILWVILPYAAITTFVRTWWRSHRPVGWTSASTQLFESRTSAGRPCSTMARCGDRRARDRAVDP